MRTIKISVTQKDIDNGRLSCELCPIALAVNRRLKPDCKAQVGSGLSLFHILDNQFQDFMYMPSKCFTFIQIFDVAGAKSVKPFTFTLKLSRLAQEFFK